ncbi:MAG: carboxypeptidase-like regulatory domain-containing protein [Patiriisocius sp.]|uniref:carboxypeptidase-like regulatory domain-containing protein n=1 Tax=Patiriisocius sp. TaxID=2822396 RepID=UPI003EF477C0
MKKACLLLIAIVISTSALAQTVERKTIKGTIVAPEDDKIEGVHIYNVSSHEGVITDSDGVFRLDMAVNDRLQVTCLQYVTFTLIVQQSIIDEKHFSITLNPLINELEEVFIKTYNLSGDLTIDVDKIKTTNFRDFDLSYETLEFKYDFDTDATTEVSGNAAKYAYYSGQYREGANLIGGVNLLTRLIFGNPIAPALQNESQKEYVETYNKLSEKFTNEFITAHYKIPAERVADFVYFVHESDFETSYLEPENELLLLNYLVEKSEEYLANIP